MKRQFRIFIPLSIDLLVWCDDDRSVTKFDIVGFIDAR